MKRNIHAAVISAVIICGSSVFAEKMKLDIPAASPFGKAGQQVRILKGGDEAPFLHFLWDANQKNWAEFGWLRETPAIPWFAELKVRVTLQTGKGTPPQELQLRFLDRDGEVFPVGSKISYDANGRGTADFRIPGTYKSKVSWMSGKDSSKRNGQFDFPIRLSGMAVSFPPKSGKGEMFLHSIDIDITPSGKQENPPPVKKAAEMLPFQFDLFTGHSVRVVSPRENRVCLGVVFNPNRSRIACTNTITVRDVNGKQVGGAITGKEMIGPGARRFYRIPNPEKYGIYYVDAVIEVQGEKPEKITRSFVFMNPTGTQQPYRPGQFRFGVNTHWSERDPATWKIEAEACRTVGIRFIRDGFGIGWIQPVPGYWNYRFFDSVIDFMQEHGLQVQLVLHGSAAWANKKPRKDEKKPHAGMPRPEVWKAYCDEIFRHYGGRIKAFEIWNEPDLETFSSFSPEEYHTLAEIAHDARNRFAPKAELLSGGFCNFVSKNGFHEKAMTLCKNLFDVHCFHGHGTLEYFRSMIDNEMLPMRKRTGLEKMPWYAHETALTSTGYGELRQARALFKKLVFAWSRGSIGYTWYDLRNDGFDPGNPEHNYGMLTNDYYPKPVYVVYNTLTGLLSGDTSFEEDLSDGTGVNVFRFRHGKDLVFAVWHDRRGTVAQHTFLTDAEQAEIVDLWGNVHPAPRLGNLVSLSVSNEPCALRLKNATRCEKGDSILSYSRKRLFLSEGTRVELPLTVFNPSGRPANIRFHLECPPGITATELPGTLLPAKGRKDVILHLEYSRAGLVADSTIQIRAQGDNGLKGELTIPVNLGYLLRKEYAKEPFAVMNRREQVVELFDADPGNVFRLWKGPQDLSAEVRVAADKKFFRIRVDATDDEHRQTHRGGNIWHGDSLQVFCQFPGQKDVWQFGCALRNDGEIERCVWTPAAGFRPDISVFDCRISRNGNRTIYELQIPWSAFGADLEKLKQGFRFNLMLNECDSDVRDSWIQIAPGVGHIVNTSFYPMLNYDDGKERK